MLQFVSVDVNTFEVSSSVSPTIIFGGGTPLKVKLILFSIVPDHNTFPTIIKINSLVLAYLHNVISVSTPSCIYNSPLLSVMRMAEFRPNAYTLVNTLPPADR